MPLSKPRADWKIAVLVPQYKRIEYTKKCLDALATAQEYSNTNFYLVDDYSEGYKKDHLGIPIGGHPDCLRVFTKFFGKFQENTYLKFHEKNEGLRTTIIEFFDQTCDHYDIIAKIDNDCVVPKNWLNDILDIFENYDVDILSPNVFPSDAAHKYGKKVEGLPYMPTEIVGGLWIMKAKLIKDMVFARHETKGLTGAIAILRQIINEKEPKIGWVQGVVVEDLGHWTGDHPLHIKSVEHLEYSQEVGRSVAW